MTIYFLFLVFATTVTAICFALIVYGLFKKRNRLVITSLVLFIVFMLITVYAGYLYGKKSLEAIVSSERYSKMHGIPV